MQPVDQQRERAVDMGPFPAQHEGPVMKRGGALEMAEELGDAILAELYAPYRKVVSCIYRIDTGPSGCRPASRGSNRLENPKEFPEGFKGTPVLSCSVTPGRTYAPCAYFTTHGLWLGRSETA